MDLSELSVALIGAIVAFALAAAGRELDRRRRRAGRRRTRKGDWQPRSSGAAVWLTDDDQDVGDPRENGHGDPRADR